MSGSGDGQISEKGELRMSILVTGGAGFIGSHTCAELLASTTSWWRTTTEQLSGALEALSRLSGRAPVVHDVDLRDISALTGCSPAIISTPSFISPPRRPSASR